MADFDTAILVVLAHEGVHSNLRGDPGGETSYGWSTTECNRLGIPLPSSQQEAIVLYRKYFWNDLYTMIPSQTVATKILDDCVNQGNHFGVLNLQTALCMVGSVVKVDGVFGPATLRATSLVPEAMLLMWMRAKQFQSYCAWIAADPTRAVLKHGMAARAAWPDPDGHIAEALLKGNYLPMPGGKSNA